MCYYVSKQLDLKKGFHLEGAKKEVVVYTEGETRAICKVQNVIENVTKELPESWQWANFAWICLKMT